MSKVVLITGASSGIGLEIAMYLQGKSYTVYGTSRNPQRLKNFGFQMLALDVTKPETIQKTVDFIIQKESKIDVLINNAGMGITGAIEDTPLDEVKKVFETNFFGAVEVIKAVLPNMRAQKSGYIINITSIAGYMGLPFRGYYSATKSAFATITEALSMEVKDFDIQVVTVAPGDFATNIAVGRYHTPVFEDSAYKEKYQDNLNMMDEHVHEGLHPSILASKVFEIINTKNPKLHYKVGSFMQKFSIVLKRVLPDRWYEKLLMNHYQM